MSKKQKQKYPNVPDDVLQEYKESFDMFDVNQNGTLSKNEISNMLKKLGQPGKPNEVNQILSQMGKANANEISFDEFVEFMRQFHLSHNKTSTDEVIEAFQVFDRDHNGFLSVQEFKYILMNLGNKFSEEEVKEIFDESDMNSDGKLAYREFVEFWQEQ